jgi:hypothetical protein
VEVEDRGYFRGFFLCHEMGDSRSGVSILSRQNLSGRRLCSTVIETGTVFCNNNMWSRRLMSGVEWNRDCVDGRLVTESERRGQVKRWITEFTEEDLRDTEGSGGFRNPRQKGLHLGNVTDVCGTYGGCQ